MRKERILGIPYDNLTSEEALSRVEKLLHDGDSQTLVFLSFPLLMSARRNKLLRMFLEESHLVIPCGKYVSWAARFLKRPLKEEIDPSVFVKRLMSQSVELGKNVYLFGGKGNTIDRAYSNLIREIPRLFVVGRYRGNYQKSNHQDIVSAIGKASPDYFFIGMGSPQEEIWVTRNRERIHATLIILVEGLFEMYAGNVRMKMKYTRRWSLETAPKRDILYHRPMKRSFLTPIFILSVFIEKLFWKKR